MLSRSLWAISFAKLHILCVTQLPPLHIEVPLHELANPNALVKHHDGPGEGSHAAFSILEAPHGFFVDGSSITGLNGVYGPRLKRPEDLPSDVRPLIAHLHHVLALGVYRHDSSGWLLANLNSDRQNPPSGGSDAPADGNEWVFIDPSGVERFGHRGHVMVPGFGRSWAHLHRSADGSVLPASEGAADDQKELPMLFAPIPADFGGAHASSYCPHGVAHTLCCSSHIATCTLSAVCCARCVSRVPCVRRVCCVSGESSHFYEQILLQYRRERAALAASKERAEAAAKVGGNTERAPPTDEEIGGTSCPTHKDASLRREIDDAEAAFELGEFDEAAVFFASAATRARGWNKRWTAAQLHLRQAASARRARDFDAAREAVQEALRVRPGYLLAHQENGMVLLDAGRPAQALQAFEKLHALDSGFPRILYFLTMSTAAAKRAEARGPPRLDRPGCEVLHVGRHFAVWPRGEKAACCVSSAEVKCPEVVDRSSWLTDEEYSRPTMEQRFRVLQRGTEVVVKRLPEEGVEITHGWEIDLMFHCCRESALPDSGEPESAPADGAVVRASAAAVALPDHYAVLSLPHDFTPDELKRAYRRTSLLVHPDKPGGSAVAFERAGAAHDCMSSAACRADFDAGIDLGRWGRDNKEESLAKTVERTYYPATEPFWPYGDPLTFADRRRGAPPDPSF